MTPVVKALFTDLGFEMASLGVQVYGGHGYIRDHGVEQFVRDARIAMLYEGTNGIQALDLVGRKMPAHMGRLLRPFFHPDRGLYRGQPGPCSPSRRWFRRLERAFGMLQLATGQIAAAGLKDAEEAGAAATDYLRLMGLVAMSYMLTRSAEIAQGTRRTPKEDTPTASMPPSWPALASSTIASCRRRPFALPRHQIRQSIHHGARRGGIFDRIPLPPLRRASGALAGAGRPNGWLGYNPIAFHARRIDGALALGFRVGPEHLQPRRPLPRRRAGEFLRRASRLRDPARHA